MKILSIIPAENWFAEFNDRTREKIIAWALLDHDESDYAGSPRFDLPVCGIVSNMQGGTAFANECEGFKNFIFGSMDETKPATQ